MKLCVRYAHTHQAPRCMRSMLPPGWSPVGYCLGSCHGYLWRGQPSALKAGRASHERSSLRNGAEARRGKTYSAENKQVHHVLHGYKFRRGEGSGGGPPELPSQREPLPRPLPSPSFRRRKKRKQKIWRRAGLQAGSLAAIAQLHPVVQRKDFVGHGVRLANRNN